LSVEFSQYELLGDVESFFSVNCSILAKPHLEMGTIVKDRVREVVQVVRQRTHT